VKRFLWTEKVFDDSKTSKKPYFGDQQMDGVKVLRAIGGAGTGKTRLMISTAEKALARPEVGGNPFAIGFSSFTRAARAEAAGRAAQAWGMAQAELERDGWFRTCHSVAYRQLGVSKGEVLGGSKADDKWVSEALGSDVAYSMEEDGGYGVYTGDPVAAAALNYWSLARSMVVPLREIAESAYEWEDDAPSAEEVIRRIEMYETAKRLDGRVDFTDLLCRFVGVSNDPAGGPDFVAPEGKVPDGVVGWIFDEAQDASKLLDMACRRLVSGDSCKWAWIVGDPFQVLYSWAGASSEFFMGWPVVRQEVMPKSYRCAAPILQLGEDCLQRLHKGYWNRGIAAADHDGEVVESGNYEDDLSDLTPDRETLVIARTNRNVGRIASILEDCGVPFRRIKTKDGAHNADIGMSGLWKLEHGHHATREEWTQAIDLLPSQTIRREAGVEHKETLLARGSKAQWSRGLAERHDILFPEDLAGVGATEHLRGMIADGRWCELVDGGIKWHRAAKKFGLEVVANPKIRIGTIHAAKGMEADNVIVLSSVGRRIRDGEERSDERHDEERRIEYVAVTRARKRLVIAHDPREKYRMELPL
jgi:superfamily I DNA/RNA helicase